MPLTAGRVYISRHAAKVPPTLLPAEVSLLEAIERRRPERAPPPSASTARPCADCGADLPAYTGPATRYCSDCRDRTAPTAAGPAIDADRLRPEPPPEPPADHAQSRLPAHHRGKFVVTTKAALDLQTSGVIGAVAVDVLDALLLRLDAVSRQPDGWLYPRQTTVASCIGRGLTAQPAQHSGS